MQFFLGVGFGCFLFLDRRGLGFVGGECVFGRRHGEGYGIAAGLFAGPIQVIDVAAQGDFTPQQITGLCGGRQAGMGGDTYENIRGIALFQCAGAEAGGVF